MCAFQEVRIFFITWEYGDMLSVCMYWIFLAWFDWSHCVFHHSFTANGLFILDGSILLEMGWICVFTISTLLYFVF